MKKILTYALVVILCLFQNISAQDQLVATLKHGDTTTLFYGASALQTAHDAAEDGDVITLSEGEFAETTLSKTIIVRGAGMTNAIKDGIIATSVQKLFLAKDTHGAIVEGINVINAISLSSYTSYGVEYNWDNVKDVQFLNCRMPAFTPGKESSFTFVRCFFTSGLNTNENVMMNVLNSYIGSICAPTASGAINFTNCILGFYQTDTGYCTFRNCILYETRQDNGAMALPPTVTCSFCLGINVLNERSFYAYIDDDTNVQVSSFTDIFKSFCPTITEWGGLEYSFSDSETFELTEEAAATYLGDDGKQVGIYGGDFPFTTPLSYPQATSVNVAKKAANGKLAVDIKFNETE